MGVYETKAKPPPAAATPIPSESSASWEMSLTKRRLAQVAPCDPCHALEGGDSQVCLGTGCVIFGLLLLLLVFVIRRFRRTRKRMSILPVYESEEKARSGIYYA